MHSHLNPTVAGINKAIDYINQNIAVTLTVEDIASHCCFSKFYFNRVFKSVVGESIYSFIKRLKLERAAYMLRSSNKKKPITDIALELGYSPSNFATAFKEYFGISATQFKKVSDVSFKNSYMAVKEHIQTLKKDVHFFETIDAKITIKMLDKIVLEYERFIGNYYQLNDKWCRFCEEAVRRHQRNNLQFVGISYDDPLITDENRCIYDMCVLVEKPMTVNFHRVEAGRYACYHFFGRQEDLAKAYNEVNALWLPFSKYELDNRPVMEFYHSDTTQEGILKADLYIPIK